MELFTEYMRAYGAAVDDAMERFLQDEALYEECVRAFAQDETFVALAQAMSEKNYAKAFVAAHSMKGVAGNLDLKPLLVPVCAFVEALRTCAYPEAEAQYALVKAQEETLRAAVQAFNAQ